MTEMELNSSSETESFSKGDAQEISLMEWDTVCAVEEFWHRHRFFPSETELSSITGFSANRVRELLASRAVEVRLKARGIDYDSSPGDREIDPKGRPSSKIASRHSPTKLTDIQLACAMSILNVADTRSLQEKLRKLGIQEATYNGWMKSRVFSEFMSSQMEEMLGDSMPLAHKALLNKVVNGDLRAIKLYYELTGRTNRQEQESVGNVKMLVISLIEILQKRISDPVILEAIANDIKEIAPGIISAPVGDFSGSNSGGRRGSYAAFELESAR